MTRSMDDVLRGALRDMVDEAGPARDLAAGAITAGRRIRRRRHMAVGATVAALLTITAAPYAVLRDRTPAPPPAAPSPSVSPSVTPSTVVRPAVGANWRSAPVELPGGQVVSGVGALGADSDTPGADTFAEGNVVLDRDAGAYTRIDAGYRSIWPAPTGDRVAVAHDDRTYQLGVIDLRTREVRWTTIAYSLDPQWSPDGKRLLITYQDGFAVLDVATNELTRHEVDQNAYPCTDWCLYTWLPGGTEVAVALTDTAAPRSESAPHARRGIQVFAASSGAPLRTLPVKGTPISWSPDGRHVLLMPTTFEDRSARVADVTTGEIVGAVPSTSVVFVQPDRVLIVGDEQALLYDLAGNRVESRRLPVDFDNRLVSVAPA